MRSIEIIRFKHLVFKSAKIGYKNCKELLQLVTASPEEERMSKSGIHQPVLHALLLFLVLAGSKSISNAVPIVKKKNSTHHNTSVFHCLNQHQRFIVVVV